MTKEQITKAHLEAIENNYEVNPLSSYIEVNILKANAVESCVSITEKYGEIKRLEGMIEAARILRPYIADWDKEADVEFKNLEKQLEQLKNG